MHILVCWISLIKKWDAALLRVRAVQHCFVIKVEQVKLHNTHKLERLSHLKLASLTVIIGVRKQCFFFYVSPILKINPFLVTQASDLDY